MILNTGSRTDIPAFYSEWFYNRVRAGYVLARNPYYPEQVTRYELNPEVVDALVFCTKNPAPMFRDFGLLRRFSTFWFVTITPYGKDIEPFVPDKEQVVASFLRLSALVGPGRLSWRYDPVFLTEAYSVDYHIRQFGRMARALRGGTRQCVVSFIDLYEKTRRNFPGVKAVAAAEQRALIDAFAAIAAETGLQLHLCCESAALVRPNVDADGCLSQKVLEEALGCRLSVPKKKGARPECPCLLGADIGAYNTCGHGCLYCYANYDSATVRRNMARHRKTSPFLVGGREPGDIIKSARQSSWREPQLNFFDAGGA